MTGVGFVRTAVSALALCAAFATGARAQIDDSWSDPVLLRAGESFVAPIHGTLLPTGEVMLIAYIQDAPAAVGCGRIRNSTALLDPAAATGAFVSVPLYAEDVVHSGDYCPGEGACGACGNPDCLTDSYFCSAHTLLANGDLAVFGGLRTFNCSDHNGSTVSTFSGGGGLDYGAIWDWDWATTSMPAAWVRTTDTFKGPTPINQFIDGFYFSGTERYYPTATRLPNGNVLVTGGSQVLGMFQFGAGAGTLVDPSNPALNLTAEIFNGSTFSAIATPPIAAQATMYNPDYTHAFVLPTRKSPDLYNVVMIGQNGQPLYLRTGTGAWSAPFPMRPGVPVGMNPINKGASTLMLPLRQTNNQFGYSNGSLLVVGGEDIGDSVDVYDEQQSVWTIETDLATDRHHPATVILPDGNVVALGGHVPGQSTGTINMFAEYIDTRTWTVQSGNTAPGGITRGYHMVALLLPDGRVMIAGGRPAGVGSSPNEHASVQFLSPPYMDRDRPTITSYPPTITANGLPFQISVDMDYGEVVLVGLGSMTHSVDMNQRHIQLKRVEFEIIEPVEPLDGPNDAQTVIKIVPGVQPPTRRQAPPGYYMMFVLTADGMRTPSEGVMIQVL